MKQCVSLIAGLAMLLLGSSAQASTSICISPVAGISCTGSLDSPEDVFLETFAVLSDSTVTIQTYGFGGGINAAGAVIPAGGFDSLVAVFSGPPTNATILMDGGNPVASADSLFGLYFQGCPPAGIVTVGTVPGNCGDNRLTAALKAGSYMLLLSDANFLPLAVDPGDSSPFDLTDTNGAYTDLTSGVFQTCVTLTDCNTGTANFAVDILQSLTGTPAVTPEPGTLGLLGAALAAVVGRALWAQKHQFRRNK
jgi:hypothetical protein